MRVECPGTCWVREILELRDPEARPLSVARAPLDLVSGSSP